MVAAGRCFAVLTLVRDLCTQTYDTPTYDTQAHYAFYLFISLSVRLATVLTDCIKGFGLCLCDQSVNDRSSGQRASADR